MQAASQTAPVSMGRIRAGVLVSALPVLFLVFDSVIKLMKIDPVVQSFGQLGYPVELARGIGAIELICVLVYAIPRSSVFGAVLLTGYLGGAIATHVRVDSPLFTHVLFPVYVAAMIWGGLLLRDERLRAYLPLSSSGGAARH